MISTPGWQIVPYAGDSPFKKVRLRDEARIQAVVRHLLAHECVALIGPPLSEKTTILRDAAAVLTGTGRYRPLYVDLWQARSDDEATFFTSLAVQIAQALGDDGVAVLERIPNPRAFQNYLAACAIPSRRHLALLVDHLQALPHDLIHSLLLALRSAYMERDEDAPSQLVAVVTGSMNLVGLSTGPTSPFNIARPVVALPLTPEQTAALAQATLAAYGCQASEGALGRIGAWAGGDRYLVPRLCAWSAEMAQGYRRPVVTRTVVERASDCLWLSDQTLPPIREAIRMIEEDPDTLLDMLHLLDHGSLPRTRSRQGITRTGTDRLQLSGAAVLAEGAYTLKNLAFRHALARHFTTERVAHVLRIAGRWNEAIAYLAPRLEAGGRGAGEQGSKGAGERGSKGAEEQGAGGRRQEAKPSLETTADQLPTSNFQLPATDGARPQLLEAIVQSIYATDAVEKACEIVAGGLRLGFGLADARVYLANPAQGRLELTYPISQSPNSQSTNSVDLYDPECVEAQTFRYGNYALRGTADEARLVVALRATARPIGVVCVERYARSRDPHELPEGLPDLLRFLQHAAGALENVIVRAAYRTIGQAVLNASTVQPTLGRVLEAVAQALGCDYAALYLADASCTMLEMAAGVGRPWSEEWRSLARFALAGRHPAAVCLRDRRLMTARGVDDPQDKALVDRFALHKYGRAFLPLVAAGDGLGALELGYSDAGRLKLTDESRRGLAAFADQVAIAVYNMQLLRRTDAALARRVAELEMLRSSSLAVSSTLDLDAVLARILKDVQALFPGVEMTIWEYHPERAVLTVLQSSLADPVYRAQRLPMESITGRAVVERTPQVEPDLAALPGAADAPIVRLGLRGMVAVPLISRDRAFGTINLYTYTPSQADPANPIGPGETELLKAFAAHAAVAIDNARLHREEIERQRLEQEMEVARQIQLSMLPKCCPAVLGWQIEAFYQPARSVGGDFYDFLELPGDPVRLGLVIADVSGHGVPAALFMALSRTIIRTVGLAGRGPASALTRSNELVLKDSQAEMFLTAVYAILELETDRLIYANAGHNRPLWYHAATGAVTELGVRGILLGAFEEIELHEERLDLADGDALVFYTDGVTEAQSPDGEMFGEARLRDVVAANGGASAEDLLAAVVAAVTEFAGEREWGDDVTGVVVKRG